MLSIWIYYGQFLRIIAIKWGVIKDILKNHSITPHMEYKVIYHPVEYSTVDVSINISPIWI